MKTLSLVGTVALCAMIGIAPLAIAQNADDAGAGARRGRHHHKHLANLSPAERKEFKAAHAQAKQDPAVQSAKARVKEARRDYRANAQAKQDPAARARMKEARHAYREAMRAALLKADPAIQPVLDKIPRGGKHRNS